MVVSAPGKRVASLATCGNREVRRWKAARQAVSSLLLALDTLLFLLVGKGVEFGDREEDLRVNSSGFELFGLSLNSSGGDTMGSSNCNFSALHSSELFFDGVHSPTPSTFLTFVFVSVTRSGVLPCFFLRSVEALFCLVADLKLSSIPVSFLVGLGRLLYPKPLCSYVHWCIDMIGIYLDKSYLVDICLWHFYYYTALSSLPLACIMFKLSALGSSPRFVESRPTRGEGQVLRDRRKT